MDHCRRRKILGKSESGVMMIFPPKSDGDRCFGRNVGYGEGRPHHAALTLRIPIMRGDGGGVPTRRWQRPTRINCWGPLDATAGPCVVAFVLSRSTGGGTCDGRLPTVADARSLLLHSTRRLMLQSPYRLHMHPCWGNRLPSTPHRPWRDH